MRITAERVALLAISVGFTFGPSTWGWADEAADACACLGSFPNVKVVRGVAEGCDDQFPGAEALKAIAENAAQLSDKEALCVLKRLDKIKPDALTPDDRDLLEQVRFTVETRGCALYRSNRPDQVSRAERRVADPELIARCVESMREELDTYTSTLKAWRALQATKLEGLGAPLDKLRKDRDALQDQVKQVARPVASSVSPSLDQPAVYLRELHDLAYKNLKRWVRARAGDAEPERRRLADALHQAMQDEGLRVPISAEFRSGYILSDTNGTAEGGGDQDSDAGGHVVWSTRHFGWSDTEGGGAASVDFSLAGRFGLQPALTLVTPMEDSADADADGAAEAGDMGGSGDESSEPADAETEAAEQQAFTWDVGFQTHAHFGDHFEVEAYGRAGTTTLFSDETLIEKDGRQTLAITLSGAGRTQWFFELGGSARLHFQSRTRLHELNGLVQPALELGYARRRDNRFKQIDDTQVTFADGWQRQRFWFSLAGVPVTGVPANKEGTDRLLTVSFGVEREWGGTVPAVTRFTIQGDVNLIKALRGR